MKTFRLRLVISIVQIALITLSSCRKEEEALVLPSVVQFNASAQSVTQGGEATVIVLLNKAADRDGSVRVNITGDATYGYRYTTDLAIINDSFAIAIAKGQTSAQFKVITVDNPLFKDSKFVTFSLTNPSIGLKLGAHTSYTIMIAPSLANFAVNSGTIDQSEASGIVVQIQLSAPARSEGSITVTIEPGRQAAYGTDFTTSPVAIDNSITFNVAQNENSASFKILPIDNSTCSNRSVSFTISSASGGVTAGANVKYYLTIKGNGAAIVSFAESAGTVGENNTSGIVVKINFSKPTDGSGIIIYCYDNKYGTKYTTTPAMEEQDCGYYGDCFNALYLAVPKDATSFEFTALPMNNGVDNSDYKIEFYMMYGGSSNGCLQIAPSAKYTLTIVDDD